MYDHRHAHGSLARARAHHCHIIITRLCCVPPAPPTPQGSHITPNTPASVLDLADIDTTPSYGGSSSGSSG